MVSDVVYFTILGEYAKTPLYDPGLIIGREIEAGSIGPAPLANAGFTGLHPEIARATFGHAPHGHPILIDRSDGCGDDPIGVAGIGTEKGWLGPEVMPAGTAEMDTHGDEEQDGVIEIEVDGDALGGTEAGSGLLAAVTRDGRQQVRDLTHLTGRVIDSQWKERESFLEEVVQIFYHAGAAPASQQTSITQSRRSWISIG